jgi:hypothetical protein
MPEISAGREKKPATRAFFVFVEMGLSTKQADVAANADAPATIR